MFKPILFNKSQITRNIQGGKIKFSTGITTLCVQPDGKILVAGNFLNYGGVIGRNRLIRLTPDYFVDEEFCVNAVDGGKFSGAPTSIAIQADGKILITISSSYNSSYNNLIRLNQDGTLDTTFYFNSSGSKFSSAPSVVKVTANGNILVGGSFTSYKTSPTDITTRARLIRLNQDGILDTAFCANAVDGTKFGSAVSSIVVDPNGNILIGGSFTNYAGITGRNRLIRLNQDGTLDVAFCANAVDGTKFGGAISSMFIQSNNKILVAGAFSNYAGTTKRDRLIRLNEDGILDTDFCVNAVDGSKISGSPTDVYSNSSNEVFLAGNFTYGGTLSSTKHLVKFNSQGVIDVDFSQAAVNLKISNTINKIAPHNNDILIGGLLLSYAGAVGRDCLVKLSSSGAVDETFCKRVSDQPKLTATYSGCAVDLNENILIYGGFGISRYTRSGALDSEFEQKTNIALSSVFSCAIQSDKKLIVGGGFTYGGSFASNLTRKYLVRLNSDGSLDESLNPDGSTFHSNATDGNKFNGSISEIVIQPNGKILVAGTFTDYAGTVGRNRLIRLNQDGTLDTAFCINAVDGNKITSTIRKITLQPNGRIVVAFVSGTSYGYLVAFNEDGTLDSLFNANASGFSAFGALVTTTATQLDGKLLVGGAFINYGGVNGRNRLIRLNQDGTLDTAFCTSAADGVSFNNSVTCVFVDSSDRIYIFGLFTNYKNNNSANYFVVLNQDGTIHNELTNKETTTKNLYPRHFIGTNDSGIISGSNELLIKNDKIYCVVKTTHGSFAVFDKQFNFI